MKWEPIAAMLAVLLLGLWLATGPGRLAGLPEPRAGAELHDRRLGPTRGVVELLRETPDDASTYTWRLLYRDGTAIGPMTHDVFAERIGAPVRDEIVQTGVNPLFQLFNITSWGGLAWVAIGLGGQVAFFGRMAVQWIVSEKEKRSVVPPVFWYLSLFGGVTLFTYFIWRQDFVGVLGQSTGVVIYARNIRLLNKQRRRDRRDAERVARKAQGESDD
ncbi:MAG: lipid-A-disaccharide synthase N-terminal domain-containing protein [Planctomycetota bacterium]